VKTCISVTALILGPLLRHVGERDATIWVETSAACAVDVRAGGSIATDHTFQVAGHHYAIVALDGLAPGSATPYEVYLDGDRVWPSDASRPLSRIRTLDVGRPLKLAFGSCREPGERGSERGVDPDVLVAYAERLAKATEAEWPTALLLMGDQVYADDTSPEMRAEIVHRRDPSKPPGYEVADFEEYTELYREAWTEPSIRWLLSTVPVSMIFDDHDVRDDWNTSHAWRAEMQATSWWEERITGALMSYWVYQHLGNLSPERLAADETLRAVRAADDGATLLRAFAQHADREADGAKGTMWSFRRDLGRVRLVVIDSRCGRVLADDRRSMISDAEFQWVEDQVADGDYDHLVIGTSLPWLLPRALHEVESWDEVLARPSHGRSVSGFGEWLRRAVDLEHWAAFRTSFDRLAALFGWLGRGEHGATPPATICVLSGDVHHTYVAEASYPDPTESRIVQVTCSPFHNTIPRAMQLVFHVGWSRTFELAMKGISRLSGVPSLPIHWHHPTGPHYGNALATLILDGRTARLRLERAAKSADVSVASAGAQLETIVELELTELPRVPA
jgi:hypothetical protein